MLEEQRNRIQFRARARQPLVKGLGQQLAQGGHASREGVASCVVDFLLPSGLGATFEKWLGRAKHVWEEELRWIAQWAQIEQREHRWQREARRDFCFEALDCICIVLDPREWRDLVGL